MKIKFNADTPEFGKDFSLDQLLNRVILGPSVSGPMSRRAFSKGLEKIGKEMLVQKLFYSTIPYRSLK